MYSRYLERLDVALLLQKLSWNPHWWRKRDTCSLQRQIRSFQRETQWGKSEGLITDCLEPYLHFSCFKRNMACTGLTAPHPKPKWRCQEVMLFFLLARILNFIAKTLFFLSFYLAVLCFSSYKSQVPSTSAAQVFESLYPFHPQCKRGRCFFSCVTSLQHELPHVLQHSIAVCCACTLEPIIFWLTVILNHQIKTNEGESQKMWWWWGGGIHSSRGGQPSSRHGCWICVC